MNSRFHLPAYRIGLPLVALTAAVFCKGNSPQIDPQLPDYRPEPFQVAADSIYLQPDGSIYIAGASAMRVGLGNLNALFIKNHPATKFTTLLSGSSVGAPALLFNLTPFAVVDRIMLPEELVPFEMEYDNRDPIAVKIGHGSFSKLDLTPTMLICVNANNPIDHLTTEQVARIFTTGGGQGDITSWGQLGLGGEWARRPIQPIGVARRTGEAVFMKTTKFGDFPFSDRYEGMKSADITPRLKNDVATIAMVDRAHLPTGAKLLAIGTSDAGPFYAPNYEEVAAGKYPYTSYIYLFINRIPGKPLDPFVREYLRMVLSKQGQQALTNQANGFLPLSAAEASVELAKLQ